MSSTKIVVGGRLVDGTGAKPIEDSAVLIEGKRIMKVGKKNDVQAPKNANVIDASGKTVMPGLVDAHTHPLYEEPPELEPGSRFLNLPARYLDNLTTSPVLPLLKAVNILRKLLRYGVTSVRILHGAIPSAPELRGEYLVALRTAVERGYFPSPRVIAAGCVFPTAGHLPSLPPPILLNSEWRHGADGIWEVRKQTRECLLQNVDVIKLLGPQGGGGSRHDGPREQGCTLEEIEAAVEEAHWHGVMVSAHAMGGPGLKNAVQAGVDTIEHGWYLFEQPEVLRMMVQKRLYLIPTMVAGGFHPVYGDIDKARKSILDKETCQRVLERAEAIRSSFKIAHKAGVKIAAGSDFLRFDMSPLAWELFAFTKEGGMTEMEAIVSATKTSAEACGLKDVGTIEEGKMADMIVLDGDPLENIEVLQKADKIDCVITEGKVQMENGKLTW